MVGGTQYGKLKAVLSRVESEKTSGLTEDFVGNCCSEAKVVKCVICKWVQNQLAGSVLINSSIGIPSPPTSSIL